MAGNRHLGKAKEAKNDEFYTQYADIEREVNAYLAFRPDVFRGKSVLLPCDDPKWSNFTRYFAQNFSSLGLRRLVSTGYAVERKKRLGLLPGFDPDGPLGEEELHGRIFTLDRDTNGNGVIDLDDLETGLLDGDGDFRSDEVKRLRDEADIVVTNPPFSLFREFIPWIMAAGKKFLVIGNMNAVSYTEIFPLIQKAQVWLGATGQGKDMVFGVPEGAEVAAADREKAAKMGYVGNYTRLGNSCWYTNLDHGQRHQPLQLMTWADNVKYSRHKDVREHGYVRYENYDAIEVPYVDAIPSDWDGVMGVPRSFLERYNPEQFEIVGVDSKEMSGALGIGPIGEEWVARYRAAGGTGHVTANMRNLVLTVDGIPKMSYARILIRKRKGFEA
jgi:hypothetical protein